MTDITQEVAQLIGQPKGVNLEYKAVLPPAATVAQLISSFANSEGGYIVLGVSDVSGQIRVIGLSGEFRAEPITRKAIELLSPQPNVSFQYVDHQGKQLFAIKVERSKTPIVLGGREYVRGAAGTKLRREEQKKDIRQARIQALAGTLKQYRSSCTAAKAKILDHYQSVLNICDDLGPLLYPDSASTPTANVEGKVLMRILFSSCADNFETYLSDLLLEIYLAKPDTLKSEATVPVRDVLGCSDMQEFIGSYAKKKVSKLQRGSVKGFIADNRQIKSIPQQNLWGDSGSGSRPKL